ncbi:MAG: lipopolysaccharide biosynthesis protein [Cyanobacteriota bacterium]
MSNLLAKAVSNSAWTAIGSVMTGVLGFLFAGLTIRWLGEAEAGFAIAIATILGVNNTFSGLGLGTAATRLISQAYHENDRQRMQEVAGVFLTTSLTFGLLGLAVLSFGSSWIIHWSRYSGDADIAHWYCVLSGMTFLFQQITGYFGVFLTSLQRFDWQTKLNSVYLLMNGIFGITLLKFFPNILTLGLIGLSLSFLNGVCTGLIVTRLLRFLAIPTWSQSMFKEMWTFGKWVYLTELKVSFIDGIDKLFLTSMFGSSSLAYYAFSQRIYLTIHGMLVGQSAYLLPMLSAQGKDLNSVAKQIEDRLRWLISIFSALIYSGLIILGPGLLSIMINPGFSKAASFQLLIFSLVGYIHAQAIVTYFVNFSKGLARDNWMYVMIAGFGYFPLFVFLALKFGYQYAVIGHLMMFVAVLYLLRNANRSMGWRPFVRWTFSPLSSSLILITTSILIDLVLYACRATFWERLAGAIIFFLIGTPLVFFLENHFFSAQRRIETFVRAMFVFRDKISGAKRLSS